ncbi:acyl carrier protein [Kitasatospora sp. NBC_00070]|uniref:acyl carrier protein n=1 Tax=Kitasatospora sp. NBC_00070 TaxID=2975962 RepID=UPI003254CD4C
MTATAATEQLISLSAPERADALRELVAAEFRVTMLLEPDEELPLDRSYFDLGLTSLRLTEIKRRLEQRLGLAISANTMFNEPTVDALVTHLSGLLPGGTEAPADDAPVAQDHALLDEILKDLYQS